MIKTNAHFLRKEHNVTVKSLKTLLILEEQYIRGRISQKMIEEMANLYKNFLDYCIKIREPFKIYFQEKLEYLYLDQKVQRELMKGENKEEKEELVMLDTEFLNFSEIMIDKQNLNDSKFKTIDLKKGEGIYIHIVTNVLIYRDKE